MPELYGKQWSKDQVLERVGDVSQIGGARRIRLADGPEDGVEAVQFRTGSGFNFLAVPGRGLDITIAEHNGRPLAWRSAAGEMAAGLTEEPGLGWLRTFAGGLVTTCGLTYAGAPCDDDGETLGIHGRFSSTPASNVWVDGEWQGDDYRMWARGKIRESRLFGDNLLLEREVSAFLGQNRLWIHDTVTNEGSRTTPHMILYHINGGFPAVDEGSVLLAPSVSVKPRDADAEVDKEQYYLNDKPTAGYAERCYYHDLASDGEGLVRAGLVNKNLPGGQAFGFYVQCRKSELPKFTQWKQNGAREYVVGLEPANCWVEGRAVERERGTLQFLEPGETREYHVEIGVLVDAGEVSAFEELVNSARP